MDEWTKLLIGLVILSLIVSSVAFFKQPALFSEKKDALDKIKETNTIQVCYISYPPFSIKNLKTGQMEGISIDIIENIAKKMGVKVEYVETTWSNIVLDLKSERCQANISGIFPLIERASGGVIFTEAYGYMGNNGVVKKEDNRFSSIDDLDQEGVTIAVVEGEQSHVYAQEHFKKAKLNVMSSADISLAFVEVSAGRADAGLSDGITTELYLKEHNDVKPLLKKDFLTRGSTFALNEKDTKLLAFLDNAIEVMAVADELKEIYAKYPYTSIIPKKINTQ